MKSFLSKYCLLVLFFLASSFHSFSQTISWQKTSGPYGGTIGDVIVHPTNFTVYSLTGSNSNGGILYRSSDNGNTWVEQKPAIFSNDLGSIRDIEMLADGTLFALAYNNLYKSIDDGVVWTKVNTTSGSASTGFDNGYEIAKNNFSGTIYVSGYDFGNNKRTIFRSANGGSTFSKGYGHTFSELTQIAVTATGDVYALSGTQLYKSVDDGVTFNTVAAPDATSVISLAAKSNGNELVLVTTGSATYNLVTPFVTWSVVTETGIIIANQTTYGSSALIAYSPDNSTMFLMDNQNNKFYSRTTTSWTAGSPTFVTSAGENAICFAARDNAILYVGTNDIGVYKSINGGGGWAPVNTGIESSSFNSIVVADDNSIINAGQLAYRSTDQGTSWTKIPEVTQSGYFAFKAITGSPKPIVLIGSNGQASFRSTNNGSSWSAIAASPNANRYVSSDGTKIAGYNNTQFFFSSNQGTSWSAALTVTGTGWPTSSFSFYNVAMDQNSVIYAYLYDFTSSNYKFFKIVPNSTTAPTTGTATQIPLATIGVTGVNAIGSLNNKVYVAGYTNSNDALCTSPDAGVTWSSITLNNVFRIDADPINNYLFATGSNSGNNYTVNLSRDGGSTFSTSSITGSSKSTVYGYALNSSGVAFAGVTNSSVFTSTTTIVIPTAPTLLASSGVGTDRLVLRWVDNATNENRFVIEKFNGTSYDSINYESSNFTTGAKVYKEITNLLPNTSYTFRVYAKNSAGSSAPVSITLSTLAQCAATIPDNRSWNGSVSRVPAGTSTLTNINIKSKGNGQYSITDVVNGTIPSQGATVYPEIFVESCLSTYLIPDYPLEPNLNGTWNTGTNTLILKWITTNGITPETTGTVTLTLNAADPVPAAPTNATAYVYNNTGIEISWIGSAFETEYTIERSKDNFVANIDRTFNVNYPATSAVDNVGLVNATTYYYRVKAKNAAGTSVLASNIATILFTKPYFVLSGTTIESTASYSTLGAIWGDFNNDGFDDLIMPQLTIFTGITTIPKAFKNDGTGNFISITPAGITPASYLVGTAADYDNDGKLDLFLTAAGTQNYLYKGNGDFTFSLVGSTPVSESSGTNFFDLGASWADYNKDGLVDLYVLTNDNSKNAKLFTQGPVGTFTKETTGALIPILADAGAAIWADYDNDDDQDVFVTDQNSAGGTANQLFKNNGNGTFTRVTGAPFDTDLAQRSLTASWGDYNNDTFLDLFIGAEPNNLLYKNNGNGTFSKQSFPTTVTETSTDPVGAAWGDVNNDGNLDLVVSNQAGENQLYLNNNNGTSFVKVKNEKLNDVKVGNFGAAFSDYNNDGYLDLAVSVIDPNFQGASGPTPKNQLFKNNFLSGNWSEIKLIGVTSNKMAVGARITLVSGGKTQIREVASVSSFCGQPSQRAHFGIGNNTSITSIQVKWPSGITQTYATPPINQILTVTEDNQGPSISSQSPPPSATGVATSTKIDITLNEVATALVGKNLVITGIGDPTATATLDVTTATKTGNTYSFTLPSKLALNKQYSVTLDAGAFTDIYGNASSAVTSGWTFTTAAGPTVSSLVPAFNATNVSATTSLAITFGAPVTSVVGKDILVYNKSNLTTPVATLAATTGVLSGNTVTFALAAKLNRQTVYAVSIDAGAFIDAGSNDFAGLATTAWEFTTDSGPDLTTLAPALNATNVAANVPLVITFNKSITAVAAKKFKVFDGTTAILDVDVSITGTVTADKYTLPAPTSGWPFSKVLTVSIDAGAFVDANQNDFKGLTTTQWSFTITEAPDVTAPSFGAFTPVASVDKANLPSTIKVSPVTDNKAVTGLKMFYRPITGSAFTEVAGTVSNAATNEWQFSVPASAFDALGVQYYFTAVDAAGNASRSPAGTTHHQTYLKYAAADTKIPAALLGFGGKKTDWKVIAIPFELGGNNSVPSVFDELTGNSSLKNKTDYMVLTYKDNTSWSIYPEGFAVVERGKGYFINIKTALDITIGDNLVVPTNSRDNLYKLNLKTGWNMIGNPYLTAINWADVVAYNSLTGTANQLKKYSGGSYSNGTSLSPFEGGFVQVGADTQILVPFQGQTTAGGRQAELSFDVNDWVLPMTLRQDELENTFGGIGMHKQALVSFDALDDVNGPRFFDYLEMNFDHPDHYAKKFARDVVPTQEEYTWSFTVDSNVKGEAQLSWNNIDWANNEKELYLLDEETQTFVNMRETKRFSFNPAVSSTFKIFFGTDVKSTVKPNRVLLGNAYPNPTTGVTTIPFTLPDQAAGYQVRLDVYDMMGRKVTTILNGTFGSGFYNSEWDASVGGLSGGVYTYRLTVSSSAGTEVQSGKIMIAK